MPDVAIPGLILEEDGLYCFDCWRTAPPGGTLFEAFENHDIPFSLVSTTEKGCESMVGYFRDGKRTARVQIMKDHYREQVDRFFAGDIGDNVVGRICLAAQDEGYVKEALGDILSVWKTGDLKPDGAMVEACAKDLKRMKEKYLNDFLFLQLYDNLVANMDSPEPIETEGPSNILYNLLVQRFGFDPSIEPYLMMETRGTLDGLDILAGTLFVDGPGVSGLVGALSWIPYGDGPLMGDCRSFSGYLIDSDRIIVGGATLERGELRGGFAAKSLSEMRVDGIENVISGLVHDKAETARLAHTFYEATCGKTCGKS